MSLASLEIYKHICGEPEQSGIPNCEDERIGAIKPHIDSKVESVFLDGLHDFKLPLHLPAHDPQCALGRVPEGKNCELPCTVSEERNPNCAEKVNQTLPAWMTNPPCSH